MDTKKCTFYYSNRQEYLFSPFAVAIRFRMTARATPYDELKEAISRAYPTLSPQLQRLSR